MLVTMSSLVLIGMALFDMARSSVSDESLAPELEDAYCANSPFLAEGEVRPFLYIRCID